MSGNNKRAPRPTLIILSCLLISAVIRLSAGGVALAEELAGHAEESPIVTPPPTLPAAEPEMGSLLESIRRRQEQLTRNEIEIAERQHKLNLVEQRIARQLAVLIQAEQRLADTLAIADSAAENDLKQLTEVYEKMKAKSAAEIFETMEVSFAAGFLSRMKPESAAGILSEMPPNAAYSISVVMAGKNANAPTE
jgi:flagellar motility protein MotE (MotC chaperone)